MALSTFLVAAFLVVAFPFTSTAHVKSPKLDIFKFLGSDEIHWTVKTTSPVTKLCLVDVRKNISRTDYYFSRSYSPDKKQWSTRRMHGQFLLKEQDKALVTVQDSPSTTYEKLVYVSEDQSCGVIYVIDFFSPKNSYYDLRVRNSSVSQAPKEGCNHYMLGLHVRLGTLYSNDCPEPPISTAQA
uniref:Lipocalin/cytosolic fatty-acid binding domain-containing protein n=1 Tax=Amblyomma maculatum TaxID=34609 RepID=G3ML38_AMBMU